LFAQYLIDGFALGAIYGVLALSFTLIFGVIRIVNFAQGEIITLGGMGALGAWILTPGIPFGIRVVIIFAAGILTSCVAGLLLERFLFRNLVRRSSPALLGLIASLGVSLFIQNMLRIFVSSSDVVFPVIIPIQPFSIFGSLQMSPVQVAMCAILVCSAVASYIVVEKTKFGFSIMAVRDNLTLATVIGMNVNRVLVGVFLVASILAAIGGCMMGMYYGVVRYDIGFLPGIKAFTASIMGGVGNVRGAALCGLLLGIIESLGAAYISSAYKDGFAFLLLILVLLFRPQGLLGARE
jgi:branched-chain amino acid transport system permease protein